jgi:hypothetical protein
LLRLRAPHVSATRDDVLYFFLDLEVCPITFDCASYLAGAELARRRLGLASSHVVIVPGKEGGLREEPPDYEQAVGPERRHWRLHHIVVPLLGLVPACKGYTLCASREEAHAMFFAGARHVYPAGYTVTFPVAPNPREAAEAALRGEGVLPMLRARPQALAYMRQFLAPLSGEDRRIVAISLRRHRYSPSRNSNDADWIAFAKGLDPERWLAVLVLDTDQAHEPIDGDLAGLTVCHSAAWNLDLRMALYELADLTMAVAQGPMELCWFNDRCRYAMFVRPNSSPHTTPRAIREVVGIGEGETPPYAVAGQRWVWTSDELAMIRSTFEEMTAGGARRRAENATCGPRPRG